MRYLGYVEICAGVGLGMGPVIGSLLSSYFDFEFTMYCFAALNLAATIMCYFLIPDELNLSAK